MKIDKKLLGSVRFRLTSADVSQTLQALINGNVTVWDVQIESELSALASITAGEYKKAKKICQRLGSGTELLTQAGVFWLIHQLQKRAILIVGFLILAILTAWLPTRIFFWEVVGNEKIPANYIISQLQQEGVTFGCKRSEIRSEKLKNQLLAQIPQLEWVGVTTSGCVAKIWVSESQTMKDDIKDETIGNIVALCDGVVNNITVTKGNPICKPGQAVQKGQILISGYENCGFILKHSGAEGEVYASTYRILEGVSPAFGHERTELNYVFKKFTLRIGKKLIKLSKDSGISYTSCVKMYLEKYVTLPGGFRLPVSFVVETYFDYETNVYNSSEEDFAWLSEEVEAYLQSQMLGGSILNGDFQLEPTDDLYRFRGAYSCTEQIGMNRIEEIFSDGKNS